MVQLGELPLPQRGPWTRLRRGGDGQDLLGPGHQRGQEFFLPDGQLVGLASPFEMVQHDDGLAAEREADPEPGMQQRPTRHVGSQPHLQAQLCFSPLARTVGETPRVLRLQRLPNRTMADQGEYSTRIAIGEVGRSVGHCGGTIAPTSSATARLASAAMPDARRATARNSASDTEA